MSHNRRQARVDINQPEIVQLLRQAGASVQLLSRLGDGCPDILVGWQGKNVLMEIKRLGAGLTDDEDRWHKKWCGQVAIVYSIHDARAVLGMKPARKRTIMCPECGQVPADCQCAQKREEKRIAGVVERWNGLKDLEH